MAHVVLTTDVKSFSKTQFAAATTPGDEQRYITTTRPTGERVIGTSLNYLKIKPYSDGGDPAAVYVWGWSFWPDAMAWIPQLLCSFSATFDSQSTTLPNGDVAYEMATATKVTGDVKIYSGVATTGSGGFVMVDTVGCQFVEFEVVDANEPQIYMFTAGL